jgi:hypothetical protein
MRFFLFVDLVHGPSSEDPALRGPGFIAQVRTRLGDFRARAATLDEAKGQLARQLSGQRTDIFTDGRLVLAGGGLTPAGAIAVELTPLYSDRAPRPLSLSTWERRFAAQAEPVAANAV